MTIVTPIPVPLSRTDDRAVFDRLRSRVIDSFGLLEQKIDSALYEKGIDKKSKPLGLRIADLQASLTSDPKFSAAQSARLEKWLTGIKRVMPVRNDLVHSPMELRNHDGQIVACFRYCALAEPYFPVHRLLTTEELSQLVQQLGHMRNQLKQLLD